MIFLINLLTQYIASYCHIAIVFVPIFLLGLDIQIDYDDEPFLFYNPGLSRGVAELPQCRCIYLLCVPDTRMMQGCHCVCQMFHQHSALPRLSRVATWPLQTHSLRISRYR